MGSANIILHGCEQKSYKSGLWVLSFTLITLKFINSHYNSGVNERQQILKFESQKNRWVFLLLWELACVLEMHKAQNWVKLRGETVALPFAAGGGWEKKGPAPSRRAPKSVPHLWQCQGTGRSDKPFVIASLLHFPPFQLSSDQKLNYMLLCRLSFASPCLFEISESMT